MDMSEPGITFDKPGVCYHCRSVYDVIKPSWHTVEVGARQLACIVEKIKANVRAKRYEGIIGIGGGFDSSCLTYLAKVKLLLAAADS